MTAEERARAADLLDLHEGRGAVPVLDAVAARALLRSARRLAIVGASDDPWRPSHSVMGYLLAQGYECAPVNPTQEIVHGRPCHPTLEAASAEGRFDIVVVFRRPEHTPAVASSAVAVGAGALWLQLGIVSWEAARIAAEGGLAVVMDRCTSVDHAALTRG